LITVFCGTWNVNGKSPYGISIDDWLNVGMSPLKESFKFLCKHFLDQVPQLVIIGIQELIQLTAGQIVSADTDKLRQTWESYLFRSLNAIYSGKYVLLRSLNLVALGFFVFVHDDKASSIRKTEFSIIKTGLGGMAGNKGGIGMRLIYNDTPLIFITAHLAAGLYKYPLLYG
jgi:synaptojanin